MRQCRPAFCQVPDRRLPLTRQFREADAREPTIALHYLGSSKLKRCRLSKASANPSAQACPRPVLAGIATSARVAGLEVVGVPSLAHVADRDRKAQHTSSPLALQPDVSRGRDRYCRSTPSNADWSSARRNCHPRPPRSSKVVSSAQEVIARPRIDDFRIAGRSGQGRIAGDGIEFVRQIVHAEHQAPHACGALQCQ